MSTSTRQPTIFSPRPGARLRGPLVVAPGAPAGGPLAGPRRIAALLLVAVGLLACAPACTSGCASKTRRTPDDTVVVLIGTETRDLDPRFAIGNVDTKLSRLVAPGLTTIDQPSLRPEPHLAERIERVDDLTWDYVLRPGLRFSDGSPVTADDVVFTFQSILDQVVDSLFYKAWSERFRRVEAIDDRRVRFHLVEPVATLASDLDFGVVSRRAAGPDGKFAGGRVIGAGPFRIASISAERVLLERNPHYFGPPAGTEKIEVRTVRDQNARTLMLIGGSADFVQNAIRVDLVDDVVERDRLYLESGPSAILTYLMMHNEDPILDDVRVRRAIALAIDRERIVRARFRGRAVLATGLLPPSHWAYEGQVRRYDHDPARARALLDEAGFPDPDGPGGAPRFQLSYKTSADQFRLAIARIIAAQLAQVGIDVEVRAFEFGTFFSDIKKGNYQLASMQTGDITEPDWYYAYFHSDRIPDAANPDVGNRWRYRNARVDALTDEGRRTTDQAERLRLYSEVQKQIAEDVPIVPLWHEDNVAVMNVDTRGYQVLPSARFAGLADIEKRAAE